ncbi:hypothetical protein BJV77DRAFT_1012401 [Russula vinacea]|jgi:hypothetical protein|nr:hypothetical protein BJV77DRAFT_1012401 [Russula vinacea]
MSDHQGGFLSPASRMHWSYPDTAGPQRSAVRIQRTRVQFEGLTHALHAPLCSTHRPGFLLTLLTRNEAREKSAHRTRSSCGAHRPRRSDQSVSLEFQSGLCVASGLFFFSPFAFAGRLRRGGGADARGCKRTKVIREETGEPWMNIPDQLGAMLHGRHVQCQCRRQREQKKKNLQGFPVKIVRRYCTRQTGQ